MFGRATLGGCLGVLLIVSAAAGQPGGFPGPFPGGFPPAPFAPPQPGQVLPTFIQDQLKLTAEQKKQLAELQKEVDDKLAKILTAEQKKSLQEVRPGAGGGGLGPDQRRVRFSSSTRW